jgi:amino-acid N-acetyltransferase
MDNQRYVEWFRNSAQYINAHRGETFVIQFDGAAVTDTAFPNLIHDLALLDSLGVRLVIVHGMRPQVDSALESTGAAVQYQAGSPVTDGAALEAVKKAAGQVRLEIEALLSMGLANSPMHGASISVTSGNFVTAKPMGVRHGIDFGHTGEVRRVDATSITRHLQLDEVVIVSPIGFSLTGEIFRLSAQDVATEIAIVLRASKLIFYAESGPLRQPSGEQIRQLTLADAKSLASKRRHDDALTTLQPGHLLEPAIHACRNGVRRCQIIDRKLDGALIAELFTRDGVGTMVSADLYDDTRQATIDDVGGVLNLIQPLEADGTLVRRSRDKLENEIDRFLVMERDGTVIACAALYPFGSDGDFELACVAVHEDYRRAGRGENLIRDAERHALSRGGDRLFVLTTRTIHWFRELGFELLDVNDLPAERQALYNYQRNSKVLVKSISS